MADCDATFELDCTTESSAEPNVVRREVVQEYSNEGLKAIGLTALLKTLGPLLASMIAIALHIHRNELKWRGWNKQDEYAGFWEWWRAVKFPYVTTALLQVTIVHFTIFPLITLFYFIYLIF